VSFAFGFSSVHPPGEANRSNVGIFHPVRDWIWVTNLNGTLCCPSCALVVEKFNHFGTNICKSIINFSVSP
jgi:hypothetical protein